MAAYVIVDITVNNPEEYEAYKKLSTNAVSLYGGKFLVRGGKSEILEGNWQPQRTVILEFESVERAKEWWNSPEYGPAKEIRQRAATTNMLVVEGV